MSTECLIDLLRAKFGPPAYGLLLEVPSATGLGKARSADALAMSLWPSRGLELHGFELKVSRTDWQKELSDPSKAEAVCRYCDRWWLVAGDKSIVRDGELPPTWGLLVANGSGLKTQVPAPQLTPDPVTREFMAAIFRRLSEQAITQADVRAAESRAFERGKAVSDNRNVDTETRLLKSQYEHLKRAVETFHEASGIDISAEPWDAGRIGDAVKRIIKDERATEHSRTEFDRVLKALQTTVDLMKRARP